MLSLSNILPCAKRGIYLKETFKDSLIASLRHLLEVAQDILKEDLFNKITEKLNFLSTQNNISSFLYAYNYMLIKSIKADDVSSVKSLFNSFCEENFLIEDKFIFYNHFNTYRKDILKEICSFELPTPISFHDLSPLDFEKTKKIIEEGFELLVIHLPDWYEETTLFVNEILILNTDNLRAGSSFDLFGLIYINFDYKTEQLTDIVSFIIHESAHLYIFLLSLKDPLVLNSPEERYQPPSSANALRMDKRPIIGIFHATFVLARIIYVLSKLHKNKYIPHSELDYADHLIQSYKSRFLWGYETLMKHGKLTDLGQELVISSKNLIS